MMKAHARTATAAAAFLCAALSGIAQAQPELEGIRLQQLSFDSAHTGVVPNTEYGQIGIGYVGDPGQEYFLNITAQSEFAPDPAWLVRNLELLPLSITGEKFIDVTTLVDLGQLGVERGLNVAGQGVALSLLITPEPQLAMPPMQPDVLVLPIEPQVSSKGGRQVDEVEKPALPPFPERPARVDQEPVGGIAQHTWRTGLDALDVGHNQCAPAAVASSFHWLESQYPGLIDLHGQTFYETLAKLKEDMDWSQASGASDPNIVRGKMRFIQREDKSFAPGWQVRYQGGFPPLPSFIQEGGMVARRMGDAGEVTFDFIESELASGADVEVHVTYYTQDDDGNWIPQSGHSLAAKGTVRRKGGKLFLYTADDGHQNPPGDKPDDDNPGNGGIRNWNRSQLITLGPEFGPLEGGIFLSGEEGINVLDFVTSERPPAPTKPQVVDCVYSSHGNVTFTAGVWTLDGSPIGKTFPGDITPPAGQPQYDTAVLPEAPNDWHWSAIITRLDGTTIEIDVDIEGFGEGDEIDVQLFQPAPSVPELLFDLFVEVGDDIYTVSGGDSGVQYHSGQWSIYPSDLPSDLFSPIDASRGNFVPPAPCPCVADLNDDCVVDVSDLGILLNNFGCTGPGCVGDLNGDDVVDVSDLGILLNQFGCSGAPVGACCLTGGGCVSGVPASECNTEGTGGAWVGTWAGPGSNCTACGDPVEIFEFIPEAAGAGELVTIIGQNFDPNPKNHCLSAGEIIFEVEDVSPDGTNMLARVVAVPPGAQPAPMMVGLGNGDCSPTPLLFPFQTGGETFFWIGDPDNPLMNFVTPPDQLFTPLPDPTASNDQTIFGTFVGGELIIDLTGVTVQPGDRVSFFFRAWCPLRHPDINFIDQTFAVNLGGSLLASVLCANAQNAFQNPPVGAPIPQLECDTNGAVMTIGYTDCNLIHSAPTAVVRITR